MQEKYWSIGSFSDQITNMLGAGNIPTTVSGTTMNNIVWQQMAVAENWVGETIDDTAVQSKYHPAITNLSAAQVIDVINAMGTLQFTYGSGTNVNGSESEDDDLKLGEFSIKSASASSVNSNSSLSKASSDSMKQLGMEMLNMLRQTPRFKKVWGV